VSGFFIFLELDDFLFLDGHLSFENKQELLVQKKSKGMEIELRLEKRVN